MTPWYERAGGYILSIFLHLLLLSLLITHIIVEAKPVEPPPMELTIEYASDPAEAAEAELAAAALPPPPSAAAGDGEKLEPAAVMEPVEEEKDESPAVEQVPELPVEDVEPVKEPVEEPAEELAAPEIVEMAQEVQEQLDIAERIRQLKQDRSPSAQQEKLSEIRAKITEEEVRNKGQDIGKYLPGAQAGAVRTFNLIGPPHIVDAVLNRYEIKIVTRYLNQSQLGKGSYLSQVQTNVGTFESTASAGRSPGIYEVFQYGDKGQRKLQELEIEALREAGFNPLKDRLIEIEFGIGPGADGPDLTVLRMRAEKIRF